MNKMRLLRYEVSSIVLTKQYKYMLGLMLIYGYYGFSRFIIPAPYGLSPLSEWSYSFLLTLLNPLLWSILILLCLAFFSEKEDKVKNILFSTPLSQKNYYLLKGSSILIAVGFIGVSVGILLFVLYGYYFRSYDIILPLLPFTVFTLPSTIFVLGISMFMGKWNQKLLYMLLPIFFLNGMLNLDLPIWLDIGGDDYLSNYLFQMAYINKKAIHPFILPENLIYSRLILIVLGFVFFILTCRKRKK